MLFTDSRPKHRERKTPEKSPQGLSKVHRRTDGRGGPHGVRKVRRGPRGSPGPESNTNGVAKGGYEELTGRGMEPLKYTYSVE